MAKNGMIIKAQEGFYYISFCEGGEHSFGISVSLCQAPDGSDLPDSKRKRFNGNKLEIEGDEQPLLKLYHNGICILKLAGIDCPICYSLGAGG